MGKASALAVRPFTAADADALSVLIRTTMRISNAVDYPAESLQRLIRYFTPEKVEQLSKERTCLVAERQNCVVGTAALDGNKLVTFFVHPDCQRLGIGTALLVALEAAARAHGLTRLTVEASLTGVGFYERHGYQRTGDALIGTVTKQVPMQKRLLRD